MSTKDPYSVLGIARGADEAEAKKAYRKLAMKYHPDRNQGDKTAEARFKEITEAYDAITKPKPAQNNGPGAGFGGFGGFGGSPFDPDFWKQGFGDKARPQTASRPGAQQSQARRPADEQPAKPAEWSAMFTGPAPRPAAAGAMGATARIVELTNTFNSYAHFVNNAINLRRAAHNEYAQRHPASTRTVRNLATSAPEIHMAEQLFDTLTRRDSAVGLMNEVSTLNAAVIASGDSAQTLQNIAQLEKRIAMRQTALVNALDVMSGRADNLRYKPKDASGEALALKL